MSANTLLKRLLDAGLQFSETSQGSAEKVVNDLVKQGQVRRKDAERTVQQLVDRGRSTTEQIVSTVQAELSKRLGDFAGRLDSVEDRLETLAEKLGLKSKAAAKKAAPAK